MVVRLDEIAARFEVADALLRDGRVDEAAATTRELVPLLRLAIDRIPYDPILRHRLALALVLVGDREGYRRACAATLERFVGSQGLFNGEAARACLVGPDAVDDLSLPRRWVEAALAREPGLPGLHFYRGLADFRAGLYERAVEHLRESMKLGSGWTAAPVNDSPERLEREAAKDPQGLAAVAYERLKAPGTQESVSCGQRDRGVLLGRRFIHSLDHDPRPTLVSEEGPGPGEEYRQLSAGTDQEQNMDE